MSKSLNLRVTSKTVGDETYFEGTVSIPNLRPTKVMRSDGTTLFLRRSALTSAARAIARSVGMEPLEVDDRTVSRAAAKRSTSQTSEN